MDVVHTATIEVKCWKEHTCKGCNGAFAYLFVRRVSGTAGTEEEATEAARTAAVTAVAAEVDMRPCPSCGLFQPDMIAARRLAWHWLFLVLAVVALIALLICYLADWAAMDLLVWIAAGYQVFDGLNLGSSLALRGAGDATVPAAMVIVVSWFVFVPLAHALAFAPGQGYVNFLPQFGLGAVGGWIASLIYAFGLAMVMFIRWHSAAWKKIRLQ